jgi:dihydroflavonol-4-reductase
VAAVSAAVGSTKPALRAPLWPFLVAAIAFESVFGPLGLQPPLHRRRLDFFRKSFAFSTTKAEQVLGFHPQISFREGALLTAQWYTANGHL